MKSFFLKAAFSFLFLSLTLSLNMEAQPPGDVVTGFEKYWAKGGPLPSLKIVHPTGKVTTEKDIKGKNRFFLFMFNPTCGHCITMTQLMVKNAEVFSDAKVAFMCPPTMMPYLSEFENKTKINTVPSFVYGVDSLYALDKLYTYGSLPQINVYSKKMKLIKKLEGDQPLDTLKSYLH